MSIFAQFKTSSDLEQDGVQFDYGNFRVRLRRAGGSNKKYAAAFQKAMKPWRTRDIDKEDVQVRRDIMTRVFVEGCVVEHSWETRNAEGHFDRGIESETGEIVPATIENVIATLKLLPDLQHGLEKEAGLIDNYLAAETKAAAENL